MGKAETIASLKAQIADLDNLLAEITSLRLRILAALEFVATAAE
jgi:hypothetical protein